MGTPSGSSRSVIYQVSKHELPRPTNRLFIRYFDRDIRLVGLGNSSFVLLS
ncbi:hypothetical protein VCRA2127O15_50117 [Vibrio crassostreae]|nr:hypothetical protein VCRA2127O15_50117 [Vibrio crassostreae]CAK3629937.1 hypothetical protein VCRA2123O13_40116 [Vibrio crassostreae]CAK3918412.1 hypothetical protein VCRA2120O6_40119 [Vibrio crassostreae]